MEENTINHNQEKGPLERCAEMATWHQLEADPAQKERIAAELAQCVMQAAKEEADRKAEQEAKDKAEAEKKADAEKAAKQEKKEQEVKAEKEAEAKAKAAEHEAWEKETLDRAERDEAKSRAAPDATRERTIEVPENIRNNPMYQQILEEQRATQARLVTEHADRIAAESKATTYQGLSNQARMEVAEAREERSEQRQQYESRQDPATPGVEGKFDPYEKAAAELEAKPLKEGQEVEGEVVEVAKIDGQNYYVVEQDGERVAVPAGAKPEHGKGDEISASHGKEGIEVEEAYGYGR